MNGDALDIAAKYGNEGITINDAAIHYPVGPLSRTIINNNYTNIEHKWKHQIISETTLQVESTL